ncbi:MAG: hypothetical protein WBB67_05670 [bacterium]
MSKISFAIIPCVLIVLLSVFFFFSPKFLVSETTGGDTAVKEVLIRRFIDVGNLIAHATFVEDAIIMEEAGNLNEIITRFRRDEPELIYIHFTDAKNKVIASSDPKSIDKIYSSTLLKSGSSIVKKNNGLFEGGFSIKVGKTQVGALYFGAKPNIPAIKVAADSSPIVLAVGIVLAIIVFIIMFSMQRNLEAKIVENINERQEEVFSPKIESLKKEQQSAQQEFDELQSKTNEIKKSLQQLQDDYNAKKREIEENPVMQSIEKLKETEAAILSRLGKQKEEEQRLNKEVSLLSQKREEVRSALEAEKKEECTLHEKLDLIKKKILHLETPKK